MLKLFILQFFVKKRKRSNDPENYVPNNSRSPTKNVRNLEKEINDLLEEDEIKSKLKNVESEILILKL